MKLEENLAKESSSRFDAVNVILTTVIVHIHWSQFKPDQTPLNL